MSSSGESVVVRRMGAGDAGAVAALCGQLGYPTEGSAVLRRFLAIRDNADAAVFVADRPMQQVIGWVHVHGRHLLESDPHAEIGGLVVEREQRGRGVGHVLMGAAERWALDRGYVMVLLRSGVDREEAHRFYEAVGYGRVATQVKFGRNLAAPPGR